MATREELIKELLADPNKLKRKKPFTRGAERNKTIYSSGKRSTVGVGGSVEVDAPRHNRYIVSQEQFLRELDPNCHDVLFNDNLPSICVKIADGDYRDIVFDRVALPLQRLLRDEQVIYLTAHPMQHTLIDLEPSEKQQKSFVVFKQYWEKRNQDGMKNKMVSAQKSMGDAGWLFYFDYNGRIKSRLLTFEDGYVLCPHNDKNGDRILESVYYVKTEWVDGEERSVEYIDSYDDRYMYRYTRNLLEDLDNNGWVLHEPEEHGFEEIPLITKRGKVAWDDVVGLINTYEEQYNIFQAIQRRFGWGLLYIKGKFKDTAKKIAGNVVLNDTSPQGTGDAKFLTPPSPEGMMDTLKELFKSIQIGASTTILLPDDIRLSGDVSGLAVQLTKELDILNAEQAVIDWQNVADKATRLFKYGLAKELVATGENPTAITDFEDLHISSKFKVWRPFNEYEYNQMVTILSGAGVISKETAIEVNTISKPDEKLRVQKETEEADRKALELAQQTAKDNSNNNNEGGETSKSSYKEEGGQE